MTVAINNAPQFRIGLLLDNTDVSKTVYEFAQWAQAHKRLQITHMIPLSPKQSASVDGAHRALRCLMKCGFPSIVSKILFKAVIAIEHLFLLKKSERYHDHLHKFDLSPLVPNTIHLSPIVCEPGFIRRCSNDDVNLVKALDLDLLITFASGVLRGDILSAAKLGVVSVHYGDDRVHRGGPEGFWEGYFREDTTGFTVQRLTGTADGGEEALFRGHVGTQSYYLLNQAALCVKSNYYLKRLVEKMAVTGDLPTALPGVPFCNMPCSLPKAHQTLSYLVRQLWLKGSKIFRNALSIDYRWNVAFVHATWRNAALWRAIVIKNPPRHYLGDPFLISKNGKNFCYVEDYDEIEHRGRISVYELENDGAVFIGVALEESFHLSFPYLFEYLGELYMCPESSENGDIRIYKCVDFPLWWKLEKIIMKNVSAVDTMLFEKDGKWWMLTNIDHAQLGDFQLELCIFSADSPFEDQWVPHPQNPIFVDASRARNGGMVKEGNRLFRVAQRQGFDFYGKSTSVNEIIQLDDSNYIEDRVCAITPTFQRGIAGTHHLHSNGKITVFDFVRLNRVS